jgi:ABC-type transporter Mla maintaining outer membrane lipid asymmetry ATPase subunit MlaF
MSDPILHVSGVTKNYGALRPLRIDALTLAPGDQVALLGLDQPAAEVLINLLTGATLPDSGQVHVFGRSTADIADSSDWLATLDRFGIVSERAALLEPMSVIQNLAMPFSLAIEPPPPAIAVQASALAAEAGLDERLWQQRVGDLDPASRLRVRLARALALGPSVLLLEHPSAALPRTDIARFGADVRFIARQRTIATLTITADAGFARAIASATLALEPATGRLRRG